MTELHRHVDTELTDLAVADDSGNISIIHTTPSHQFWDQSAHAWREAASLDTYHQLATDDGGSATVLAILSYAGPQTMYNLTVDVTHTYYVLAGNTPVLVHNDNVIPNGTLWTGGDFPVGGAVDAGGPANGVLYRTQNGAVSNYAIYDSDGVIQYRVDLVGGSHRGVDTPHYQPYKVNTNPTTGAKYPKPTGDAFSGYGPDGAPRLGGC